MKTEVLIYKEVGDNIGRVDYVDHLGDDRTIVNAARVSFNKEVEQISDKDRKLIAYLKKNKHTSPFEHCLITFRFTVPLFVARQHHRHRTWAFNEISRRYTSEDIQFYLPNEFRVQHASDRQASEDTLINPSIMICNVGGLQVSAAIETHVRNSLNLYENLLSAGICREQARMILPQNMYTKYYGTVNLNNLFKFLELRLDEHAQWEIRKVAEAMKEISKDLFPNCFV